METMHLAYNVHLPFGRGLHKEFSSLSSTTNNNILLSKQHHHHLVFHAKSPAQVRCCTSAHSVVRENSRDTKSIIGDLKSKGDVKFHDDETLRLKQRGGEIVANLKETCIYLVGMMGSGKTTVGKLVADALGYDFIDSDRVIEEAAGGVSVAQFFKQQKEESFRDAETQILRRISSNARLVVATGGGIVIRPVNWTYLRDGVTVWLDVPLESLAERVVAVGTHSRPLLGEPGGGSAYDQALARLTSIFERRVSCYANADTRVSLQKLALSLGVPVCDVTPAEIALQALEEIDELIAQRQRKENESAGGSL